MQQHPKTAADSQRRFNIQSILIGYAVLIIVIAATATVTTATTVIAANQIIAPILH